MTKILSVTADNASSNETFFDWLEDQGLSSLSHQLRCLCHIFNLGVQDLLAQLKVPAPVDDEVDSEDFEFENEVTNFVK